MDAPAALLTFALQSTIETALRSGTALTGALFDIEKCFNNIPRQPILFLAEWLGLDTGVITAWDSFLRQIHRSFLIHQVPSEPLLSDTGLPEGDSMSCVGMLLLTFSFHFYMDHFQPRVTSMSYVDNLELLASNPGELLASVLTLETWASLLHLRLDAKKSMFWALDAADRRHLSTLGLTVTEGDLDLGATMIYGARHRNAPLQNRILSVKPFWTRLRTQRLSAWHKLLVIRQALLPRALYGSELVFLGFHWFTKLRSQIMKALKFDRAGANPVVRLAFACGLVTDPLYVDAWKTLVCVVGMIQSNEGVHRNWLAYYALPSGRRTFGPFAKFLLLLDFLDWRLVQPCVLELMQGVIVSLETLDVRSFKQLFNYCWSQKLTSQVRHRQDFWDLFGINFAVSFSPQPKLDRINSELLDCIRDGTFFLSTTKAKYDVSVSELCPCGRALDTLEHRALSCPRMMPVHLRYMDVRRMWHTLPTCMVEHGLCPANPYQECLWAELARTPWTPPTWRGGPTDASLQMLFTDGSCSTPETPLLALAS